MQLQPVDIFCCHNNDMLMFISRFSSNVLEWTWRFTWFSPEFVCCGSHWKCISCRWGSPSRRCPLHPGCSGAGWGLYGDTCNMGSLLSKCVSLLNYQQYQIKLDTHGGKVYLYIWRWLTHGIGRTAYSCCIPWWSHLPHNVGKVVLPTYFMRFCSQRRTQDVSFDWCT